MVIRNEFVGINASDVNFTAGTYLPGVKPPFDCGFEAVGTVASVGEGVTKVKAGDPVLYLDYGAFSEMKEVQERSCIQLPKVMPEAISLATSGLTASIALEQVGDLKSGETVLVTAAAGATGSYAVQLAKMAGCHVIGTCSSDAKGEALRKLGVDRVINYKKEKMFEVLRTDYPKGVDVVYESVGGQMFQDSLNNLAKKGRLIVIGMISGYKDGSAWKNQKAEGTPMTAKLLAKSASVRGFFLMDYAKQWKPHMQKLTEMVVAGKLQPMTDPTKFVGLEQIADAVDHMYDGKNVGKIVVQIPKSDQSKL